MYIHNLSYSTKAIPYQLMQDCVHQQYGPIRIHIISPGGNRSIPFLSPNYTGQEPLEVEEAAQTSKKTIEALEHIEDKAWLDKTIVVDPGTLPWYLLMYEKIHILWRTPNWRYMVKFSQFWRSNTDFLWGSWIVSWISQIWRISL